MPCSELDQPHCPTPSREIVQSSDEVAAQSRHRCSRVRSETKKCYFLFKKSQIFNFWTFLTFLPIFPENLGSFSTFMPIFRYKNKNLNNFQDKKQKIQKLFAL